METGMKTAENKTALWKQNGERFVYWTAGGVIRYRRPSEVGFKSMPTNQFWRYFRPLEYLDKPAVEPEAKQAVQRGLFSGEGR